MEQLTNEKLAEQLADPDRAPAIDRAKEIMDTHGSRIAEASAKTGYSAVCNLHRYLYPLSNQPMPLFMMLSRRDRELLADAAFQLVTNDDYSAEEESAQIKKLLDGSFPIAMKPAAVYAFATHATLAAGHLMEIETQLMERADARRTTNS